MPRLKIWFKLVFSVVACALLIGALYVYLGRQSFQVTKIDIELLEEKDPSGMFHDIKNDLIPRLTYLLGKNIWAVDLSDILEDLEKDRRIKDVQISRQFPDRLRVNIKPHRALANLLARHSDRVFPLSRDGSLLPPLPVEKAVDAPILRGRIFFKDLELRDLALSLLLMLPEEGPLSLATVSEVLYSKRKGFVLVLGRDDNEVIVGTSDFKKRVDHVARVVQYLRSENLRGRVIDARFTKKVVVRLRKAS